MISETSQRVRATTCSRMTRVASGELALGVLGVVRVVLELDLDAGGPGRGVGRAGQAVRERLDEPGHRGQREGRDPDQARDRPEGVEQGLGPDPADDVRRQVVEDRDAHGQQQGRLEVEAGRSRPRREGDDGGEGQAADDGQGLGGPLGGLVVVRDGVGPPGPAVQGADLLEPGPGVGPEGAAERDQRPLQRQQSDPQRDRPAQVQSGQRTPSRPSASAIARPTRGNVLIRPSPLRISPSLRRIVSESSRVRSSRPQRWSRPWTT